MGRYNMTKKKNSNWTRRSSLDDQELFALIYVGFTRMVRKSRDRRYSDAILVAKISRTCQDYRIYNLMVNRYNLMRVEISRKIQLKRMIHWRCVFRMIDSRHTVSCQQTLRKKLAISVFHSVESRRCGFTYEFERNRVFRAFLNGISVNVFTVKEKLRKTVPEIVLLHLADDKKESR